MTDVLIEAASILEGEAEAWQDSTDEDQLQRIAQMIRVAAALRELVRTKPQW